MQEIDGLVVYARVRDPKGKFSSNFVYGPYTGKNIPKGIEHPDYQRFSTNGLVAFEDINQASYHRLNLYRHLTKGQFDVTQVGCAQLYLRVAEDHTAWDQLDPKMPFVLISDSPHMQHLYGMLVDHVPRNGYLPVSDLEDNGFKGWRNWDDVRYAFDEVGRQGGMKSKIANLDYRLVSVSILEQKLLRA